MNLDIIEGLSTADIKELYDDIVVNEQLLSEAYVTFNTYCTNNGHTGFTYGYWSYNNCSWYYLQVNGKTHSAPAGDVGATELCRSNSYVYYYVVSCF